MSEQIHEVVAPSAEAAPESFPPAQSHLKGLTVFSPDLRSFTAAEINRAHRQHQKMGKRERERSSFIQTEPRCSPSFRPLLPFFPPPPPPPPLLLFICSSTLLQRQHSFP